MNQQLKLQEKEQNDIVLTITEDYISIQKDNFLFISYAYDSVGNVKEINDSFNDINISMEYDYLDRLTYASRDDNDEYESYRINYGYNSIGNIEYVAFGSGENLTYSYNGDIAHAPSSISTNGRNLSVHNLSLVLVNNTDRTYRFEISSEYGIERVWWVFFGGDGTNVSSNLEVNLSSGESIFVNVEYDYSDTNSYSPVAMAYNENFIDYETIPSSKNSIDGSFVYDTNGNMISDGFYIYTYNGFNQLEKLKYVNGTVIAEYLYDHGGNRLRKNTTDETTYYLDNDLIEVVNSSGTFDTVYFYHRGTLIAKNETALSNITYYHPEHLGSSVLITKDDGEVYEETNYKPFGEVLYNGNDRFGFTGKELDKESDLQYYGQRYYNPSLRMFVEPDSIILDYYNPQSLNRYSYVLNNPYKYVDEEGNAAKLVISDATQSMQVEANIYMIMEEID